MPRVFRDSAYATRLRGTGGHPPVWTVLIDQGLSTIGTLSKDHVDPALLYELLKSLEPAIAVCCLCEI
jgi:hypothetical protein